MSDSTYSLYILRCADGSLYTGISTNVARRVAEHNAGSLGARYTSARRPVVLVYTQECGSRSQATKEELRIKSLTRTQKLALIGEGQ